MSIRNLKSPVFNFKTLLYEYFKFSFKEKDIFKSIENIQKQLNDIKKMREITFGEKIYQKFEKMYLFFFILVIIGSVYYFYLYVKYIINLVEFNTQIREYFFRPDLQILEEFCME